jgi:MFS family permease
MQLVAEGLLVYRLTNSAFSLGLVGFIVMVPMVFWTLLAGALADRMSRRTLLAWSQLGQIFPPLVLAALTWSDHVQVWHVIAANLIMGLMSTLDQPARQALIAEVVEPGDLDNALALTSSGFNVARVVGPAVAGVLISSIGLEVAFAINGLSFIAVLIALALMRLPQHSRPARQASLAANLVEGGRYFLGERTILALIVLMTIVSFFVLPYQTLLPVFAVDVLRAGPTGLGFLTAAAGFGAIFGVLVVTNLSRDLRGMLIVALVVMVPFFSAGFAFSRSLALSSLMLAVVSGGVVALKTLGFTLIQIRTRDELRGRVTSMLFLMMGATPRVGGLVAGYLASRLDASVTLGLGALGCLVFGLLALIAAAPSLRQMA